MLDFISYTYETSIYVPVSMQFGQSINQNIYIKPYVGSESEALSSTCTRVNGIINPAKLLVVVSTSAVPTASRIHCFASLLHCFISIVNR